MYVLSNKSKQRLHGVDERLISLVERSIEITKIDFVVLEGVRTIERQKALFNTGASKTLNSRHLTGHAVDLAPLKDGKVTWEWYFYNRLAETVSKAASELSLVIRWGGVWDRRLHELKPPFEDEIQAYVNRMKAIKKKAFLDGPHFELPSS